MYWTSVSRRLLDWPFRFLCLQSITSDTLSCLVHQFHLSLHPLTSLYKTARIPHSQADSACPHERQHESTIGGAHIGVKSLAPGHARSSKPFDDPINMYLFPRVPARKSLWTGTDILFQKKSICLLWKVETYFKGFIHQYPIVTVSVPLVVEMLIKRVILHVSSCNVRRKKERFTE